MIKASRIVLEKLFDIREGEFFRALSMQFNIFLIITTLLVLKPTVNSLFLSTYGVESLPYAFILVALAAGLITTLYSRILQRIRFDFLISGTLIFSVLMMLFLGIALRTGFLGNWILYIFYIWVALFALLATSQFWLLANMVFNAREIKRLVGFIGAGAIAGGIFGGYLTSYLTKYISSVDLPFVGAFFIALCIPLTFLIWAKSNAIPPTLESKPKKKRREHPFKIILQSRHLTLLACIVAVSNIVAKLVDYQFGGIASRLITDAEELTAFFGFWFSTFNVVSFVIQLAVTRFIVSRYGIGISLMILPGAICLAVLFLILAPELLLAVIVLKMADGSLKQSINKSAMELLILPININVKNQTKPFIDVFIDSLATGFSGILLIFVVKGLYLSTTTINVIILIFVAAWMYLVVNVHKEYLYSFKMKIVNNLNAKNLFVAASRKRVLTKNLEKILTTGTKEEILNALQQIRPMKEKRLNKTVRRLLQHPSADIRAEAIQYLHYYKNKEVYEEVEKMIKDPSTKVKLAAFAYLIEHTPLKNKENIDKHLDSEDDKLSGLALISLAIEIQNNPKLQRKYNLEQRILDKLQAIPQMDNPKRQYLNKIIYIKAIGQANIPSLYRNLRRFFDDKNPAVARQAMLAAGSTKNEYFVKDLIRFSATPPYARTAIKALLQFKELIVTILSKFAKKSPEETQLIRKYPGIVKRIGTQKSIKFLFGLLEHHDPVVRQEALKALSDLHYNYPSLQFKKKKVVFQVLEEVLRFQYVLSLIHVQMDKMAIDLPEVSEARKRVISLLRKKLDTSLENIFHLLSLRYSAENISVIFKGLKSRKPRLKATALEYLDNLLEPRLKKMLTPLFEVAILDITHRKNIYNLNLDIPDEMNCYRYLLNNGRDIRLKIATLHLINKIGRQELLPLVRDCIEYNDPELKLYAKVVAEALQGKFPELEEKRS